MPDFQFTFTIQGISTQRATAIRDKITQRLGEEDVTVTAVNSAQRTRPVRVIGVDTATGTVFDQTVEATSRQDAEDQARAVSATRVVAWVMQP